jgi:hypothetical protein
MYSGEIINLNLELERTVKLIENILIEWFTEKYNIKTKEISKQIEDINGIIEKFNKEISKLLFNSKYISNIKNERVISIMNKIETNNKLEFGMEDEEIWKNRNLKLYYEILQNCNEVLDSQIDKLDDLKSQKSKVKSQKSII